MATVDSSGLHLYTARSRTWYGPNLDFYTEWESSISPAAPPFTFAVVLLRLLFQSISRILFSVRESPITGPHHI